MLKISKVLLNLFKGPYSVKNIALGMIETIQAMAISRTRTSSGERIIEILDRARGIVKIGLALVGCMNRSVIQLASVMSARFWPQMIKCCLNLEYSFWSRELT